MKRIAMTGFAMLMIFMMMGCGGADDSSPAPPSGPPEIELGPGKTVNAGNTVTINGTITSDGPVTLDTGLLKPSLSTARVSVTTAGDQASFTFFGDLPGSYILSVTPKNNSSGEGATKTVVITVLSGAGTTGTITGTTAGTLGTNLAISGNVSLSPIRSPLFDDGTAAMNMATGHVVVQAGSPTWTYSPINVTANVESFLSWNCTSPNPRPLRLRLHNLSTGTVFFDISENCNQDGRRNSFRPTETTNSAVLTITFQPGEFNVSGLSLF